MVLLVPFLHLPVYHFSAGDDVWHDGIDEAETFDAALRTILTSRDLSLNIKETLLNDSDQGTKTEEREWIYKYTGLEIKKSY